MELEKAKEILIEDLRKTKIANECGVATKGEFDEIIEATKTVLQALEKLKETNNDLRLLYRRTAQKLQEKGKDEIAGYFLAQIHEVPTFSIDSDIDYYEEYYKMKKTLEEKDKEIEHWKNGFERELEKNRENVCEITTQSNKIQSLKQIDAEHQKQNAELQQELKKAESIIARFTIQCKQWRAFCRRIRKDEKHDVDEFNQGREFSYIQFLNLIDNEAKWEYEGKHFNLVEEECERYFKEEVESEK